MDKTYDPTAIEQLWYSYWEKQGYFTPAGDGPPYCIMIPPPNVTGTLHMGHAFQDTIMDALTRYHRMCGYNTLWQPGTDHAGIATQMVVERQINADGLTRHDLGREAFTKQIWQWKAISGGAITHQLRRMGASVDWHHERFTMDSGMSAAVCETFVRLYEEGLIYRGKRLVNWDPVLRTAISDLEVIATEESGSLWYIRYPLVEGNGGVTVSTTRPETMLGDTAVAVHPEDPRYQSLIGKQLKLPLSGRTIPIIADWIVDPDFGSGCVKITPAHDFNDYKVGERHRLALINVLTLDARMNQNCPEAYQGLDRFEARQRIIADLERLQLLERTDNHKLMIPRGDRSQAVIEPYLTDQWFVRVDPLAKAAIQAVDSGAIRFVPEHWAKTYFDWMNNIEDWCISRQIWWGHRIPAWYDAQGNTYVGRSEQEVRTRHALDPALELQQDEDVLDTWYSSALWPFSTLGWPEQTKRLQTFYPTTVLVTGFDIIFFWVARMIMFGLKFTGEVPFHEVYIHGLVRDADGNKMSKSKGNILDPLDLVDGIELSALIKKRTTGLMQPQHTERINNATKRQFPSGIPAYGTDALRFTFCSLASGGRDIRFELGRIEGYRNFCNKLWNAARYVLINTGEPMDAPNADNDSRLLPTNVAERWILSLLEQTTRTVRQSFDDYRFDLAARAIYDFTWNEYCDWYLELAKIALQQPSALPHQHQRATRKTLLRVLETILKLAHPIMPFITEAIWQRIAPLAGIQRATIMQQPYPLPATFDPDPESVRQITWLKEFVLGIRAIRGKMNIAPGRRVPVLTENATATDRARIKRYYPELTALAQLQHIEPLDGPAPPAAIALLGPMRLLLPLADLIDKQAEMERITRQITKLENSLKQSTQKLSKPGFVERAPASVVAKERQRAASATDAIAQFNEQMQRLATL